MKFESPELTKALEHIGSGLAQMREVGIFPIHFKDTTITEEGLRNEITTLLNEPYTVAVCGVVKAGKSSLLNALIFGDTVLPSFDTPLTAKLTFIEYTEEQNPYFEVTFYDRNEWNEIRGRYSEKELQALDKRVEQCAKRGARLSAYVLPERHETVRVDDLRKLDEYVTDPNSGKGTYTPFVKSVTVRLHNESIKAIRVVDTPGLNDSNVINSIETANWVSKAHAVIYVLKVRGAAAADVEFFQSYFPSTAADARIFVQNQIDTEPEGYKAAKASIKRYGNEERYKKMGLFGQNETICSYSALGVLLKAKTDRGEELTEEEAGYWEDFQYQEITEFDPDCLAETLSKKLYAREGHVRINRIRGLLTDAYRKAVIVCSEQRVKAELKVKDSQRSIEECDKEIKSYKKFQNKLTATKEKVRAGFIREVTRRREEISAALSQQVSAIETALISTAEACGGVPMKLKVRVPNKLSRLVRNTLVPTVMPIIDKASADLRNRLEDVTKLLDTDAVNAGIYDEIVIPSLDLTLHNALDALRFEELVDPEEIYAEVPSRFEQFFTIFTGESAQTANAKACDIAVKAVKEKIENIRCYLENGFVQIFDTAFLEICNQYETYTGDRQKELKRAKENHDTLKQNFRALEAEAKTLAAREATLNEGLRELGCLLEGI
ncbi:MAG TPA: dynamin family protein [Candidatus Spyradosoma merdigallinarum]|uniref:Dynamin family protein n=1 Tax=Candidatus Spyradosoma merdigallinarum TaxID=2840950 RepID=A0A9D1NJ23_9BACT|nr:dynamin family protein [Candidatus Spyradosoma merdigallinarum]